MSSKFWASLSDDYEKLFETGLGYDVIIYAGEEPDVEEIHAHSNILCIRSRYFHASFSNEWARKKDGKFILKKPNIEPRLLRIILRFLYCGHIELKDLQGLDVLKLLVAVDELNIQPLISHLQECLIEHQTEFLHQNPTGVLEMVYNHETFTDLWNFYLETICSEPKILFDSDQFPSLKAPLLESLLGRDDLNMDEIEIWDHLLRWCMIQHHVKGNLTGWSKEEVAKVERSLCRFVPLIRFYGIQPSDFFYKVYCYQEILPKELIHELLEFHIVPDVKPKVDTPPPRRFLANSTSIRSSLVDSKYVPLFVSWIDRKEPDGRDHPYEFELLYQSGPNEFAFNATEFHKKCDNKGPTIWIAKVQDSNRLIGGYNPLDWNGHRSKKSGDSFLFGFADGRKPDTAKVGYVDLASDALCCFKNQGPSMGDLYCSNGNHWIYGTEKIYPDVGIPAKFAIEACEVFRVIKRRDVV